MTRGGRNADRWFVSLGSAVLFFVAAVGLVLLIAYGPYWFKETAGLDGRWRSQEIRGNRTAILTMIGGTFAAFGAFITYQNLRVTRRSHQTDRFSKALELLADSKSAVRLGGVYALNAIALESPIDAQAVANVLSLHGQSSDAESGEADRAAAKDVVSKLAPEMRTARAFDDAGQRRTLVAIAALIGGGLVLATGYALLPPAGDPVIVRLARVVALSGLVGLLVAFSTYSFRSSARNMTRLRQQVQRPLFDASVCFVVPAEDQAGFDVTRSRDGERISHHLSVEAAVDAAREAFGLPSNGVVLVLTRTGDIDAVQTMKGSMPR